MVLSFSSCEKWIDPEINIDPDSPADPSPTVLLSAAQARTAYTSGSFDVAGTTGMWLQQITGNARQAAIINNYTFTESDVVNLWNFFYRDAMHNLYLIIEKTKVEGSESYWLSGIAKVMMAYNLGLATQLFGDVPYSEAWQGIDNLHPVYDSQENIYATIQTLLDEAISELEGDMGLLDPAETDMIYGGAPSLWIAAANALKARYYMHTAERNNTYSNALSSARAAVAAGFSDFQFEFGAGTTERNPLYQFDEQRTDASESSFFSNILASYTFISGNDTLDDPRTSQLIGGATAFGDFWGSKASPVAFITGSELHFIIAEGEYRAGNEGIAADTLVAAVEANMSKLGVSGASWLNEYTTYVGTLSGDALLEEIMMQKYIALFMNPEAFVDWRRTGYPTLTPTTGAQIPRRFPYSTEERNYNKNIPKLVSIFARNWFDVE